VKEPLGSPKIIHHRSAEVVGLPAGSELLKIAERGGRYLKDRSN
jgi:hypothetical protein